MFSERPTSSSLSMQYPPHDGSPRSWILQVGVSAGRLCGVANSHLYPSNNNNDNDNKAMAHTKTTTTTKYDYDHSHQHALTLSMTELLMDLYYTSQSFHLNLIDCIHHKLELNHRKYPVELCKVRSLEIPQHIQTKLS